MWFVLSLGSAFVDSVKDIFSKRSSVHLDEYIAAWSLRFFTLLIVGPLMLFHLPKIVDQDFWVAFGIVIFFGSIASVLYMKALKNTPLSIALPIASLTPIFILFTSRLVNRELPSALGIAGVCITVLGAYVLQWSKRAHGFFTPLTHLVTDQGPRYMLIVALLWSITSPYDKIAIQHTNPFFYVGMQNLAFTFVLLPFVLFKGRLRSVFKHSQSLAPLGFGHAIAVVLQMIAVPLTFVSYVTAMKRSSSVFGIFWGRWFFKEDHFKERLVGCLIILMGIILMVVS